MSSKKSRNPEGRPSKYKPEYCDKLIEHMTGGLSYESFAAIIGVHRSVLWDWEEKYPDFKEAKGVGFDKSLLFWEQLGVDNIINKSDSFGEGQSSSRSINATVWIFNMKNRFKWRDKQPDESDVIINNVMNLSDEELDAKIAEKTNGNK